MHAHKCGVFTPSFVLTYNMNKKVTNHTWEDDRDWLSPSSSASASLAAKTYKRKNCCQRNVEIVRKVETLKVETLI